MNKPLQHIFLGLLCLFGSNLIAQQKVADHPTTRSGEPAPVVIYGEIMGRMPDSPIYLYSWPRYTGRGFIYQESEKQDIQLDAPDFFRGAVPTVQKTFNVSPPPFEEPFYVSMRKETASVCQSPITILSYHKKNAPHGIPGEVCDFPSLRGAKRS